MAARKWLQPVNTTTRSLAKPREPTAGTSLTGHEREVVVGGFAACPNNLPAQLTTFIGREREAVEILELVRRRNIRLVTLTGPGGVGKTRLALQVGRQLLEDFADGVFFVALGAIADPGLVTATIAQILEVREVSTRPLLQTLQVYLRDRTVLLLLDNFEH